MSRNEQFRHTLIDIIVEIIGIVILGIFLLSLYSITSRHQQESNSITKLNIAEQRLEDNNREADENLATYDDFSQAKIDSIAYFLAKNKEYKNVSVLARQWGLSEFYLLGADKKTPIAASGSAMAKHSAEMAQLLSDFKPYQVEGENTRYYAKALPDGRFLIGARDVYAEDTLLAELRSPAFSLDTIKVGNTGYIFAIDEKDGTIIYHRDESFIGKKANECGYDMTRFPSGFDGILKINGIDYYCISRSEGDTLLVSVVPWSEMSIPNLKMIILLLSIFTMAISLLVVYARIIRKELAKSPTDPEEYWKVKEHLYFDRIIAGKIKNIVLLGLIGVFLCTVYIQTLAPLSRQAMISKTKLGSVVEILDKNKERMTALTDEYDNEYVGRAENIAFLLQQDPTLVNNGYLTNLALNAQIKEISVFNDSGKIIATNSVYNDFTLSTSEKDQSYDFWEVVRGFKDSVVQEARENENGAYMQYIGVKRLDAEGMVQIGMRPERLENRIDTTTTEHVLHNIAVENDGFLFAIDKESKEVTSYPDEKFLDKSFAELGIREAALADDFSGFQNINHTQYYVRSVEYDNNYIYIAVPLTTIYASRAIVSIWTTVVSAIIISILYCFLVFRTKTSVFNAEEAKEEEEEIEEAKNNHRFFFELFSGGRTRMVQSAATRWSGVRMPWYEKNPEQKIVSITTTILSIAVLMLVCYLWFFREQAMRVSVIAYIMNMKWEKGINLFSITYVVLVTLQVVTIATIIRRVLFYFLNQFGARSETIGRLLNSFIKYAAIIGSLFYCLSALGIDTSTLMTSAGLLSLVIGLGANKLIGDILAGIFIVFEGEFRVGDIVTIDGWRGTVLEIGIRTTKIQSGGNDIKIFNNSDISGIINMTKQFSYAFIDVGVEYEESLEKVESILEKELPNMKKHLPAIVAGPFYKGVTALADSSVNIRILAQCKEGDRVQLTRDMNRDIKLMFDKHNINIPFPQVVVNQPTAHEKATYRDKLDAEHFVKEQKELSKDLQAHENN